MSKYVKKITRPVSKVLDKIVPNEIKPALPYLAAFAPYMLPGGGIFSSMIGRGLGSAGANAFSQLAQEGNEGELNALSLLLAGGQGALTAPGAGETLRGMKSPVGDFDPARNVFQKARDFGSEGLANLADKAGGARDTIRGALDLDPTKANLTLLGEAAATPISLGTGDLAYADAMRTKKDFDRAEAARMVQDAAFKAGMDQEYIDSITESMTKYGYNQDEINEILEVHGFDINMANGGRVGLREGGLSMMGQMDLLGNNQSRPMNLGMQNTPGFGGMGGGNNSPIFPRLDELQSGVSQAENSLQDINGRLGAPNGGSLSFLQAQKPGLQMNMSRIPEGLKMSPNRTMPFMNGGRVEFGMGGDIMDGIMNMISKESKDPDFGGIPEAVDNIQNESKEYLFDNKLKFEVGPGENEQMSVLNALFADEEGIIPEDRKQQYYNLYINDLYRSGEIPRSDYDGYIEEGILTKPKYNIGGSVLTQGTEIENLMAGYEPGVPTTGDLYDMNNPDYKGINKKIIIEFMEEGIPLGYTSPEEYFDDFYGPFAKKEKNTMTAKDGGIMNNYNMGGSVLPQGMEMDYRQGGMIPMGSAERADDVPARVSKNEFVMTADAVRAAGGGSVNKGAQKMYQLMNNLEAKV